MADGQLKTGTTTLAIVCKDGVVVAADKRATAGNLIAMTDVEKVIPVNGKMMLTIAGSVSDAQLLVKLIKAETRLNQLRLGRQNTSKEVANLIGSLVYNQLRGAGGVTHFLFAAQNVNDTFEVYDIYPDGSVSLVKDFISSGSGSVFAFGVLEAMYKKGLSIDEGIALAKKSIASAIAKDTASGNGADIYKLTKNGVEKVETLKVSSAFV